MSRSGIEMYPGQDQLYHLWDPSVTNENEGPYVQKLLRIAEQGWQTTKQSARPSEGGALCDCTGHLSMRLSLVLVHSQRGGAEGS